MSETGIHMHQERTVSSIAGASFRYIILNARTLLGPLALYALPCLIACFGMAAWAGKSMLAVNSVFILKNAVYDEIFIPLAVAFIFFHGASMLQAAIVNRHLVETSRLQGEKPANSSFIRNTLRDDFNHVAVNYILFNLTWYALKFFASSLVGGMGILFGLFGASSGKGILESFFSSTVFLVPVLILGPFLFYLLSAALFIGVRDETGAWKSLKKAWAFSSRDLRTAWIASTAFLFGYALLTTGLLALINGSFLIGANYTEDLHYVEIILASINVFFNNLIFVVYQVAVTLYFGNLEERQEGISLKMRIEQNYDSNA